MSKKKIIALVFIVLWVVGVALAVIGRGNNITLTSIGIVLCFAYGLLPTIKIMLKAWSSTIGKVVRGSRGFAAKMLGFLIGVFVGGFVCVVMGVIVCPFIAIRYAIIDFKNN